MRDMGEAHRGEDRLQHPLLRGAEFNEFKAVKADRVFEQVCHERLLILKGYKG